MDGAQRAARAPEFTSCSASFEAELDYVLRTLRRHGVSARDAEDLAQDVFLVMWRRWSDFDPGRPLRAWLAGIAFRVAHEHHKRSHRWWPRESIDPLDERPLPDEQVASAHARALVMGALARLPERQRTILVMHDLDELPMSEIAVLLDVPLFTGYSRLRLARKSFARAVERLKSRMFAGQPALAPAALLDIERVPPSASPVARHRAISRARAWLANPGAPQTPPPVSAPVARGPLLVAGAGAMTVLALAGVLAVRKAPEPQRAPTAGAAASTGLAQGLIGYWRFDEVPGSPVARDLSGQGNDCLIHPGKGPPSVDGVFGAALSLDGQRWLECQRSEPLAKLGRAMSIAVWVRPTAPPVGRTVVVGRQLGTSDEDHFLIALRDRNLLEVQSHLSESATKRRVPQALGRWFHVAAVQPAGGDRMVYVDGVPIGRSGRSKPVSLGGGTNPLTIGGAINGPDRRKADEHFTGDLDELAVYDRALTESEVRTLAAGTQPLP